MRVRTWLFNTFRETARRFAFQEYDAPVLEKIELWERKAGEEVGDQMYNFVDKEGHRVTLRPEMTPSARAHDPELGRPLPQAGQMVLDPAVLAVRDGPARQEARALSMEYGYYR